MMKFFIEQIKGLTIDQFLSLPLDATYALMDEYADWKVAND